MQGLIDRLIDDRHRQFEHRADTGRRRHPGMGDMVDLVRVQGYALYQGDMNFIGCRDAAQQIGARAAHLLGHGQQCRNIVAGMRIFRHQECVVKIQFADRRAVRPGRPFRIDLRGGG